jgi:hypothetical protein
MSLKCPEHCQTVTLIHKQKKVNHSSELKIIRCFVPMKPLNVFKALSKLIESLLSSRTPNPQRTPLSSCEDDVGSADTTTTLT